MKISIRNSLFAGLLNLILAATVPAAPGDLDLSFAGTGSARVGFGGGQDFGRAVVAQPDGKVVVAGSTGLLPSAGIKLAVLRYDTNNALDLSFGNGGKVVTPVSASTNASLQIQVSAVQIQSDNKIVVAGSVFDDIHDYAILVRLNPDGSFDNSFGVNGFVTNNFGSDGLANGLVIQPDGKLVIAGYIASANGQFVVARLQTNGLPDPSFGVGGQVTDIANGDAGAYGVTLQADGKIVAVGTGGFDVAVLRYTTNGTLDGAFGPPSHPGKVFTHLGAAGTLSIAYAVTIEPGDGVQTLDRIVVGGLTEGVFPRDPFFVARYNLNGSADFTLNGSGVVITQVGPGGNFPNALLVQGTGAAPRQIILGGFVDTGADFDEDFCTVRYNDNGTLDSSFGGSGVVTTSFGPGADEAFGMTFVPGGKLLVAGFSTLNPGNSDMALARYNLSDGNLDNSFGNGGKKTQDITDRTSQVGALAIQADGKIVAVGNTDNGAGNNFVLARFNPDGGLDTSFGGSGKTTAPFGGVDSSATAVAIQPDGKIVAAGSSANNFAVVRYNTNGLLDPMFNGSGIVTTSFTNSNNSASAIALQPDGKIVVAGSTGNNGNDDFAVVRYNTNGTPDLSFGGTSKVVTAISTGGDHASAVKIQPDGKIVVGGYGTTAGTVGFAAVRYATNGTLDNSFGSFGRVATVIGSGAVGAAMALQPDSKIVMAGYAVIGSDIDFGVLRYTTNGTLDNSFNGTGKVTTAIGLGNDLALTMALQTDGKILVAGVAAIGAQQEIALVRYNTNGAPDDTYGFGGKTIADFGDNANNIASALAVDSLGRAAIAGQINGLFGVARLQGDPYLNILSTTRLTNGHTVLTGLGVPGANHSMQASTNNIVGGFAPLGSFTPDASGNWQFDDATAVTMPQRFYRVRLAQ